MYIHILSEYYYNTSKIIAVGLGDSQTSEILIKKHCGLIKSLDKMTSTFRDLNMHYFMQNMWIN